MDPSIVICTIQLAVCLLIFLLQIVDFDDNHLGIIKFLTERTPLAEYKGYGKKTLINNS